MSKTIFITGASRGFGKIWVEAFLKRGDKVAATSRSIDGFKDIAAQYGDSFLQLQLDITNRAQAFGVVNQVNKYCECIDVLINKAALFI